MACDPALKHDLSVGPSQGFGWGGRGAWKKRAIYFKELGALAIIFRELMSKLIILGELSEFDFLSQTPFRHINIEYIYSVHLPIDYFWLAFRHTTASISGSILARDQNKFSKKFRENA